MHAAILIYGLAVAWFTRTFFRIASLIYQFETFPRTYGSVVDISLADLARLVLDKGEDLPGFRVVVPAYHEAEVIEATMRRLAAANYPRHRIELCVVTYADEPPVEGLDTTGAIARRVAGELNDEAGRELARVLSVPADYDGYFPGAQGGRAPQIGKPRGLNYALRSLHEDNERDERALYLHLMQRRGWQARAELALRALAAALDAGDAQAAGALAEHHFDPAAKGYIGALARSAQLRQALALAQQLAASGHAAPAQRLHAYVAGEAARFFLHLTGDGQLAVMADKAFLHAVMERVEALDASTVQGLGEAGLQRLHDEQPLRRARLEGASDAEMLWQQVRGMGTRWLMVYDADADAPADLMRHLAACILSDDTLMGFQGPVAPVANLHEVHPVCALGGLWMAFWHGTHYPRLMGRPHWAHPLAGTNWCFRIEGHEHDGRLVRNQPYDEARRRFLLSFDPEQLTEDLEAGIRLFNDWKVNAEWHPYVELEQVPPTPRGLVVQRTRWTLGTLQTLRYILRSRLPRLQRLRFTLHPVEIIGGGAGPVITLVLWVLTLSGALQANDDLRLWTFVLTVGNLLYVLSFLRTHARFERLAHDAAAVRLLRQHAPRLAERTHAALRQGTLGDAGRPAVQALATLCTRGLAEGGFIARHLHTRCTDHDPAEADTSPVARLARAWNARTPSRLPRAELPALVQAWQGLAAEAARAQAATPASPAPAAAGDPTLATELHALHTALVRQRRRDWRLRVSICLWTFPYLFYQLLPYFKGLLLWLTGRQSRHWRKTPRTPKAVAPGLERSVKP